MTEAPPPIVTLVIDDDRDYCKSVKTLLEGVGEFRVGQRFEVHLIHSLEDFTRLILQRAKDNLAPARLILQDNNFETDAQGIRHEGREMDGLQIFLPAIQDATYKGLIAPGVCVLLVSALDAVSRHQVDAREIWRRSGEEGVVDVIRKPVDSDELFAAIARGLDLPVEGVNP